MRDPHVVSLRYRLVPTETVSFDQPPPVERDTEAFHMRLADGIVTFKMLEHHASEESARRCVEPYLREWELHVALDAGRSEISFEFEKPDIIDRDPPPPGTPQVIQGKTALAGAGALHATAHVMRRQYPEPPQKFRASARVKDMWWHYDQYLQRHERFVDMANFCLKVLERSVSKEKSEKRRKCRELVAQRYNIDWEVLDTLGELASKKGDERTARKPPERAEAPPHTQAEIAWIEAAVRALIRQLGQFEADHEAQLPKLTMGNLPKLPSS